MRKKVNKHRIIVRIEFATVSDKHRKIDKKKMDRLAMVLSNLRNTGLDILVVSSGAIALGTEKLKLNSQPETKIEMQATAAIGQVELIRLYQQYFSEYNQIVAQVLLASDIESDEARINNAKNTFNTLLEMNIIPIINENDSVSTSDIELDDNYPLALSVARIASAQTIVIKQNNNSNYLIVRNGEKKAQIARDEYQLFEILESNVKIKKNNIAVNFPALINEIEY